MSDEKHYPAAELCKLAADFLAIRYPTAMIVRELSIGSYGSAMIDLAAVTADEIIGVEIKGIGDTPTRLKLQAVLYAKAATRMYLLPTPKIEKRCNKHAPSGWGLLRVREDGTVGWGGPYAYRRSARLDDPSPILEPAKLPVSPRQLVQAFDKAEVLQLAAKLRIVGDGRSRVGDVQDRISEMVALRELIPAVCQQLRERNWSIYGRAARVMKEPS